MDAHIVYAHGSPSPTLVLPAEEFPTEPEELPAALAPVHAWLVRTGSEAITKVALVGPSALPGHDLDYRFVQLLPGRYPEVELRGSCGHSILAALVAAARRGLVEPLRTGSSAVVNVLNNGDRVLCEVEQEHEQEQTWVLGAHFLKSPPVPTGRLLLLGEPLTTLTHRGREVRVSVVSAGNPYVFVPAAEVGAPDARTLFTGGPELFEAMSGLRRTAAAALGWSLDSPFPKIAALLPDGSGGLAARAISVPSWHPTIALTGAVCLAAAAAIRGTVPHGLVGPLPAGQVLRVRTPGGTTAVSAVLDHRTPGGVLHRVGIRGKQVRHLGEARIDAPTRSNRIAATVGGTTQRGEA